MENNAFADLKKALVELGYLGSVSALLGWDQNVNVQSGGHGARADLTGYIAGLKHHKFTSKEFEDILWKAVEFEKTGSLTSEESFIIRKTRSDLTKAKKLPSEFVESSERLFAASHEVWANARARSDFSLFEPYLVRIVSSKRKEADYLGYLHSPYDALMDDYEPDFTSYTVSQLFKELKAFLIPFISSISESKVKIRKEFLNRRFPLEQQSEFIRTVAKSMGFDFTKGRLDTSIHPFCESLNSADVRLTTRYDEKDFINQALMSVIHETGHGLYEQGLRSEWFGTPLGESISLGIHESQSRLWENLIGRSLPFWKYFFPKLQKTFPDQLRDVSLEEFYKALNIVKPGFIRVDADEVTYNLHVIMRFEIERDLIENRLEVKDLPGVWNAKMKKYFGLKVPNDAQGVLQDIHWSCGAFGYFHTYALGNLYAAQFFAAAQEKIPTLDKKITKNSLLELREWLRKNIHVHGELYLPKDLILRVTGGTFGSDYFEDYISEKYSAIYEL